ncbi:MAG: hypothetical protein JWO40_514 [Candidatus Doudnabacteria bacterium]|nr:hypothetical protein [Candidatus Doudnabacteria bacterium]
MSKELYLKIDDDVARTVAKVKRVASSDLTLVFPKGAMVLSNVANLKMLKMQIDLLGKTVSILTNDQSGQNRAVEAGFPLLTFEMMRQGIKSVPVAKPAPTYEPVIQAPPIFKPKAQQSPEQTYVAPVIAASAVTVAQPVARPLAPQQFPAKSLAKKEVSNAKIWFAVCLLFAVLVVMSAYLILPHANITVYAHTQPIGRTLQISIDKNVQNADSKNLVFPGQILDKDQIVNKTYLATGKLNVGTKAQGAVQFYNYTGKTLKFNADTTTLSVGTNLYHLQKNVSGVKPTKNISGTNNPDPASLTPEIAVVADQNGDNYNLPAGTRFEIHNQVLGDTPQTLYAYNSKPIDGGVSKFTSIVTQQDLDNAKNDLKQSMLESAKSDLFTRVGLSIIDSGAQVTTADPIFDKKVNDAAVSFNTQMTGHVKALAFDQEALQQLVVQRINLTLDSNKVLNMDKAHWTSSFKTVDLDKGTGVLDIKYDGFVSSKIDPKEIEAEARGKTVSDLKENLLSDPNIDGADIVLAPSWAKTLPNLNGRIKAMVTIKQP